MVGYTAIGECMIGAAGACAVILGHHTIPKGYGVVRCQTAAVQFPVRPRPCVVARHKGLLEVVVHGTPGTLESVIIEVRRKPIR